MLHLVDAPSPAALTATERSSVVLFDGVCNLCNGSVQFILDRDPAGRFRFASLQSEAGQNLLRDHGRPPQTDAPDSVILVEGASLWERSDAALRIATGLGFPWRLLAVFRVVPRPLRDAVYRWIARNRYRWFGRTETCRLPSPALRARFLS